MRSSKWYWIILVFVNIGDMFNYIKGGKKNVQNDGADQNVDNNGDDGWDDDTGVVGLIPKPLSDSDTGGGEENPQRNDQNQRGVTTRPKHRHRVKRRK